MNLITRKLRSRSGASMLIALVFMMFCLFIGGSVLAAASANGYRVAHLSDQQDFLNQRSAALLIADEVNGSKGAPKLKVSDVTITRTPMILKESGAQIEDTYTGRTEKQERVIAFSVELASGQPLTVMQRLMLETTICRYLQENNITLGTVNDVTTTVELSGFNFGGNQIEDLSDFWHPYSSTNIGGSIAITGNEGTTGAPGAQFTGYTAYYSSDKGNGLYDFMVTFGDYTQMTVSANAYMSSREIPQPGDFEKDADQSAAQGNDELIHTISAVTIRTTVRWQEAEIQKGGAGA